MNREKTMKEMIKNSNFSFTKKFIYFLIAPAVVLFVGVILLLTVNFNLGVDYAGGTVFRVYTNYEKQVDSTLASSYNIEEKHDYNTVCAKVSVILNNNGVKIVSMKKSTMTIRDYHVYNGQAIEVVYQGNANTEVITNQLIDDFGYDNFEQTVSNFDEVTPLYSFSYVVGIACAIVFALLAALIYMALRFSPTVLFVGLLTVAFDLFMTLGLIAITRTTINLTLAIVIFASFLLGLFNLLQYYMKWKELRKQGKFDKVKPFEVADIITRELTYGRVATYLCLMLVALLLVLFAVPGVRQVALGLLLALVVSLYDAEFILPTIWGTFNSIKKKKNKYLTNKKDMSE